MHIFKLSRFNITNPIDMHLKQQLLIKSREFYPIGKTIWKDSDCWCSTEFFPDKLKNFTSRVQTLMSSNKHQTLT